MRATLPFFRRQIRYHPQQATSRAPSGLGSLEWKIFDDAQDDQWHAVIATPGARRVPRASRPRAGWLAAPALALLLLVAGRWVIHWADHGASTLETELSLAVEADSWTGARPPLLDGIESPGHVEVLDYRGTTAVVSLVITDTATDQPYRQTQVYQCGDHGWSRVSPSPLSWGDRRRHEAAYFIYDYYARDEAAVLAAAAKLDRLYPDLVDSFSVPRSRHKLVIEVSPTAQPESMRTLRDKTQLFTASPSVYLAPVAIDPADLLAEAVTLVLLNELTQAQIRIMDYTPGDVGKPAHWRPSAWYPLAYGMRLWYLWRDDLPLAQWRVPVVHHFLSDQPTGSGQPTALDATALCSHFAVWRSVPVYVDIPVWCAAPSENDAHRDPFNLVKYAIGSPLLLADLVPYFRQSDPTFDPQVTISHSGRDPHPANSVALATVVEYIAHTYGHAALPALLTQAPNHDSWETLIPALFHISAAEFERGWHAYLAQEYDIQIARTP